MLDFCQTQGRSGPDQGVSVVPVGSQLGVYMCTFARACVWEEPVVGVGG